jgi:hypothetical protein
MDVDDRPPPTEEALEVRRRMLIKALQKDPVAAASYASESPEGLYFSVLDEVICNDDIKLTTMAVKEAGLKPTKTGLVGGKKAQSTARVAMQSTSEPHFRFLAEECKVFEGLDEGAQADAAAALSRLLAKSLGDKQKLPVASLALDHFKRITDTAGHNPLFSDLIKVPEAEKGKESDVLELLKLVKAKGVDLLSGKDGSKFFGILHYAALKSYCKVADLAVELGADYGALWEVPGPTAGIKLRITPLQASLCVDHAGKLPSFFLHSIEKYGIKPVTEGVPGIEQPFLGVVDGRIAPTDAFPIIASVAKRWKDVLDPRYYPPGANEAVGNAISAAMQTAPTEDNIKILEFLLTAGFEHVTELANQPVVPSSKGRSASYVGNSAQLAFSQDNWQALYLLLKHTGVKVTIPFNGVSLADSIRRHGCPDRRIVVLVKAAVRREETEAEKAKVVATNSAVPSNAFEDPTTKVLSAAEEKKKAKKREQKKKAKAKKRAAAAAVGGSPAGSAAAGAGAEASDSDSSGTDDEEAGLDEEERMLARAPTFDLEKEKAARKARAEAEAASK